MLAYLNHTPVPTLDNLALSLPPISRMASSSREREPLLTRSSSRDDHLATGSEEIASGSSSSSRSRNNADKTAATRQRVLPNSGDKTDIRENVERYARLFGVDEESFDRPTTTRRELWSYYLYYNGDNGVGPGSYSQTL